MSDVTKILSRIEEGESSAAETLLPLIYNELRRLAAVKLSSEWAAQSIQATELVHEAYLRLVGQEQAQQWNGRGHFFTAAAEAMRRILVERARRKATLRAGGKLNRVAMPFEISAGEEVDKLDLFALNEALEKLERKHPRRAEIVKLRYFAGLSGRQAASVLGIGQSTADSDWAYARAWLRVEMQCRVQS